MKNGGLARTEAMTLILAKIDKNQRAARIRESLRDFYELAELVSHRFGAKPAQLQQAARVASTLKRMALCRHPSSHWPRRAAALVQALN